ncbi:trans-aconitate methyltransferase 1 [Coemansia sp. RSA 1972]|nr:trans-aconitate methyltransferase 1 [Coemansia sp. RSA 1972]
MATYSNPQYSAANYQTNRPRYRETLVDTILAYHKRGNPGAETNVAVDVATGTGIFARQLPAYFAKVMATDISGTMLESARASSASQAIEYVEASAEDLSFLGDSSVDVMTVATGAHWFDTERFAAEARRVLRPSGTLAIFGYTGFGHFVDYPQCDKIIKDYGLGDDRLGRFWDRGREVLVNGYRQYHAIFTRDAWTHVTRNIYPNTIEGESVADVPAVVGDGPVVMDFQVTWRVLQDFLLTWSTLTLYHKEHPERENAAVAVVREMMAAAGSADMDEQLNVQWEEILLMCRPPQSSN